MSTEIENIIEKRLRELPPAARQILANSNWRELVQDIVRQYNLEEEQEIAIEAETQLILLGFERRESYIKNLMDQAEISQDTASAVYRKINQSILLPIEKALSQNQNPPKPTTPKPVAQNPQQSQPKPQNQQSGSSFTPQNLPPVPKVQTPQTIRQQQPQVPEQKPVQEFKSETVQTPKVDGPKTFTPYDIPAPTTVPPIPIYEDSNQKYREIFEKQNDSVNNKGVGSLSGKKTFGGVQGLDAEVKNILGPDQQFGAKLPDEEEIPEIKPYGDLSQFKPPQTPAKTVAPEHKVAEEKPEIKSEPIKMEVGGFDDTEPIFGNNPELEVGQEEVGFEDQTSNSAFEETPFYKQEASDRSALEYIKSINKDYQQKNELKSYGVNSEGRTHYKKAPAKIFENRIPQDLEMDQENQINLNKFDSVEEMPLNEEVIETLVKKIDEVPHKVKTEIKTMPRPMEEIRPYRRDPYREPVE